MDRHANTSRKPNLPHTLPACCVTLLLLATYGCGTESPQQKSTPTPVESAAPDTTVNRGSLTHPVVQFETTLGAITVRLDAEHAPLTVHNFMNYVNNGYYSETLIHYVAADKMIVGGGFTADGQPKPTGPSIRNEAHNGLKNLRGTIAMARDDAIGIDSATSQYFINLVDARSFDHQGKSSEDYGYCVFGEVVDGMDVVERISRASTRDGGGDLARTPDPPVVVTSVQVVR